MKVDAPATTPSPGAFTRALRTYDDVSGQFPATWLLIALLNLLTQAVYFYEMVSPSPDAQNTGEFGIFNAALAIIGLLTLPAVALQSAFRYFFARAQSTSLDQLRASSAIITETFAWIWGASCFVLVLLPGLPRFTLVIFTLMNVLLGLGAVVSGAICTDARQGRRWALLLVSACLARLALGGWFTAYQPWAEATLAAFLLAGFITLAPALRPRDINLTARLRACAAALNRSFLTFAAATLSVLLGIYLFTNADRIAALSWMNITINNTRVSSGPLRHFFDVYQATGLLARGLLWGTQPLLWLFYAERSKLDKTTPASLKFFWIYLGTLVIGAFCLGGIAHLGTFSESLGPIARGIGPTLAAVMIPLGLLQALAVFSLASRRFQECFVIGGCGIAYALVLEFIGRRPETMLPYMFGASMVALMIVLFVGVVRWGRKQP